MSEIAIIGAGLAGVELASSLKKAGHFVALFEKNDQCGGRLATHIDADWQADIGTQYFTAQSSEFQKQVAVWQVNRQAQPWRIDPRIYNGSLKERDKVEVPRFVGTPTMSSIIEPLLKDLPIYTNTRIDRMEKTENKWRLWDSAGEHFGLFDAVLITAPLAQTLALLPPNQKLGLSAQSMVMKPCWCCALRFDKPLPIETNAIFSNSSLVSWAGRDSSKPQRDSSSEVWVVHFSSSWTGNHLQATHNLVENQALSFLSQVAGVDNLTAKSSTSHCWLYATNQIAPEDIKLWDDVNRLGIAGDWTMGTRLEDAWISAKQLGKAVMDDESIA